MTELSQWFRASVAAIVTMAICSGAPVKAGAAPEGSISPDPLTQGFRNPPQTARPQVWWHWMNGNVSLEGAKLDLEWMKRVGVGGVHIFAGALYEPHVVEPPVNFMSERWRAIFREATLLARREGMDVAIAGSPGWSETGGTWVAPEDAMKKYVWSETQIEGGRLFDGPLAQPPATTGRFLGVKVSRRHGPPRELSGDLYRDSVVIAFPTPSAESAVGPAKWTSSAGAIDLTPLAAGDLANTVSLAIPAESRSAWVQAVYEHETTLAALTLGLAKPADIEIQAAAQEGAPWRTLLRSKAVPSEAPAPQRTYAFPSARAQVFRIVLTAPAPRPLFPGLPSLFLTQQPKPAQEFAISRLTFSGGARVDGFESKAGFQATRGDTSEPTPLAAPDAIVPLDRVIDLTASLDSDGRLHWEVPPGRWTVLRLGWSLTGQTNGPAGDEDTGLEVDKLDGERVRGYIDQYLSMYERAMGARLGASSVQYLLTDSWEAGVQNWSPGLLAQFKTRRGYDPLPYLPVLIGRVVESSDRSERFLWDFYRTLKELLADNHYAVLARALHERGMKYYTEAEGDAPRAIGDGMTIKARSDIPTAEFWYRPFATLPGQPPLIADLDEAASAAHVYGKPLAAAESMTVAAGTDPWAFSPAMLKPVADEIFAHGINRILVHESHHQPFVDRAPGLELGFFGQFFNRNDTWAEQAGPWVSYLARTSFLLQQGHPVTDIAVFYGEDRNLTERYQESFNTEVPAGFAFDYINPEALLTLLSVRDGRLVTPGGASYRVLYIPPYVTRMTLPVLRKLGALIRAGAVVVGAKPIGGLGVQSPDSQVRAMADEVWAASSDLHATLANQNMVPDVMVEGGEKLSSVHRRDGDSEIYFLANPHGLAKDVSVTFRVHNKRPQIWHAEDGRTEPVSYEQTPGGVRVPLHFEADEAEFVVFHGRTSARGWTAPVSRDTVLDQDLGGPWTVKFQAGRGAPQQLTFDHLVDWSTSSDPRVKYFSGAAEYSREWVVPSQWLRQGRRVILDLGAVRELAVVRLDGELVATAWHAPYEVDLTPVLTPGIHRLEIQVVNLWVNRLIGDKQPGAQSVAFAPQSPYTADSPLRSSGLLGPVRFLARDSLP